jgi:hypothetical protein
MRPKGDAMMKLFVTILLLAPFALGCSGDDTSGDTDSGNSVDSAATDDDAEVKERACALFSAGPSATFTASNSLTAAAPLDSGPGTLTTIKLGPDRAGGDYNNGYVLLEGIEETEVFIFLGADIPATLVQTKTPMGTKRKESPLSQCPDLVKKFFAYQTSTASYRFGFGPTDVEQIDFVYLLAEK